MNDSIENANILEHIAAPAGSPLPLPRALLVFAHSDDEVIAVGGRLERFAQSRFLSVTDSAPRDTNRPDFPTVDAYRAARKAEQEAAFRHAGLPPDCRKSLSITVVDKEAMQHLPALARALAYEIEQFAPESVLTHPYEGGHPDHDACAFAVHAAVRILRDSVPIVEAPFYHAGSDGNFESSCFLTEEAVTLTRELDVSEQRKKQERFACFPSQAGILQNFTTEQEQYRPAPMYDFTEPPHPGQLLYEQWGWEIDGAHFRELAREALRELGLA